LQHNLTPCVFSITSRSAEIRADTSPPAQARDVLRRKIASLLPDGRGFGSYSSGS
jgi:hypothetical protein